MQAELFVRQLLFCAPTTDKLNELGLSEAEATEFIRSYACLPKSPATTRPPIKDASDPLIELLSNWDLSNVQIGMVSFLDAPEVSKEGHVQIARVELDPLFITADGREVVVSEAGSEKHLLWRASKTGGQLLDALIVAAKFLTQRAVQEINMDDSDAAKRIAELCATLAGGTEYHPFYAMLVGDDQLLGAGIKQ
jgi:hypothetical protein